MKKFKKIFAVILSLAMVLGMSMTSLAAKPSGNDTAEVTIKGLTGEPTVTLYQVVAGDYGTNGLLGWKVVEDYKNKDNESIISLENGKPWQPGSEEITALANALAADSDAKIVMQKKVDASGVFKEKVGAGAYIAIITGANDQSVYNPIILSASYNENSLIVGGEATAGGPGSYLYGLEAVAKKTGASISKEISDGTETDESNTGKPVETASIGDAVTYTIKPTMPSYPAGAVNKTVYVSDTMVTGLKFIPDSMEITFVENENVKINTSEIGQNGVITFTRTDTNEVIAYAKPNATGFNLRFIYNALANGNQGAVFTPVITYQAVITEDAVVGKGGNTNDVTLYYANKPNTGSDYEDLDKEPENPDPENPDYNTDTDDAVVHTYQLAIRKVDSEDTEDLLPGAVFGVYTDAECTNMIDKIITDDNGIAVSTKVEAGDYWVKELVAPNGYSISETPVKITANWMSTTTTVTTTTKATRFVETTTEAGDQIGWLDDDGNFYRSNEKVDAIAVKQNWKPAKIVEDSEVTTDTTESVATGEAAAGAVLTEITNTTIAALPSTGGIGTTIFTIGGCIIMVVAAALFFASRRKSAK